MELESATDTNYTSRTWNGPQKLENETGRIRNQRKNRDHPYYNIIENSQNTEKSPEETCCYPDSSVRPPANADVKNSQGVENEKRERYLDLVRELEKLWNMKVTVIPIIIGALGTVPKGLVRRLDELEIGG